MSNQRRGEVLLGASISVDSLRKQPVASDLLSCLSSQYKIAKSGLLFFLLWKGSACLWESLYFSRENGENPMESLVLTPAPQVGWVQVFLSWLRQILDRDCLPTLTLKVSAHHAQCSDDSGVQKNSRGLEGTIHLRIHQTVENSSSSSATST